MADEAKLHAMARIELRDPAAMREQLCNHFTEHGTVTRRGDGARLDGPYGVVEIDIENGALGISITSPNETYLFVAKSSVAEHLFEFAEGEAFDLSWQGDMPAPVHIPYFRETVVRSVHAVTPAMATA